MKKIKKKNKKLKKLLKSAYNSNYAEWGDKEEWAKCSGSDIEGKFISEFSPDVAIKLIWELLEHRKAKSNKLPALPDLAIQGQPNIQAVIDCFQNATKTIHQAAKLNIQAARYCNGSSVYNGEIR